jgi:hypothetical protein
LGADHSMEPEDILTPEQLAKRLQVGVGWVYEQSRSRGEHSGKALPVLRCGRYLPRRTGRPSVTLVRYGANPSSKANGCG